MNRGKALTSLLSPAAMAGGVVLSVAAPAAAAPGDLLIAEYERGTVVEFGQGGDLSQVPAFATGLSGPAGLCVGPGGDIYVAEAATGEITVITDGGDMTDAAPFGQGPFTPVGLWCDDDTILASDPFAGLVVDVTAGGDLAVSAEIVAYGLELASAVLVEDQTIWTADGDIHDVTPAAGVPQDFTDAQPHATGRRMLSLTRHDGALLAGDIDRPEVVDAQPGGDLAAAEPWAVLPGQAGIDGLLEAGTLGLFAVTGDQIFDITVGGDLTGRSPLATGSSTGQLGFVGMIHHVCSSDDDCDDGDACNGVERCLDNSCQSAEEPLDCDDADPCTVDACDPETGCSHEPTVNCCVTDEDCALGEICSQGSCTPLDDSTSGAGSTGGHSDSTGPSGGFDPGDTETPGTAGSDTDGPASTMTQNEGPGCACTAAPGQGKNLMWLALVWWIASVGRRGGRKSRSS